MRRATRCGRLLRSTAPTPRESKCGACGCRPTTNTWWSRPTRTTMPPSTRPTASGKSRRFRPRNLPWASASRPTVGMRISAATTMLWCSSSSLRAAGCRAPSRPRPAANLSSRITERLAQEARPVQTVAPGVIHRLGDPDARAGDYLDVFRAGKNRERRRIEREPVLRVGDAERLAQPPRTRAQQPLVGRTAAPAHGGKPERRRECADQDGAGDAFRLADEIEAPVDAVGAVDIGVTGRTEHHRVARGAAVEGMRRGVALVIGLDLDDDAVGTSERERRADELGRYRMNAAGEEFSAEQVCHFISRPRTTRPLSIVRCECC